MGDEMNCVDCTTLFSEYYDSHTLGDGFLEPDVAEEITAHLAACESCRLAYQSYVTLFTQVKNLPEVPLPENYHKNLVRHVKKNLLRPDYTKRPVKKSPFPRRFAAVASLMAVAASLIFVLAMWNVHPTPVTPDAYIPFVPFGAVDDTLQPPIQGRGGLDIVFVDEPEAPEDVPTPRRNSTLLAVSVSVIVVGTLGGVILIFGRLRHAKDE